MAERSRALLLQESTKRSQEPPTLPPLERRVLKEGFTFFDGSRLARPKQLCLFCFVKTLQRFTLSFQDRNKTSQNI